MAVAQKTEPAFGARVIQLVRSRVFLLVVLASQFVLVQLATGPLFGDAPRNLHWGILTAEQPAFLIGAPDTNERIKGFPPDPPSLSQYGLYEAPQGSLHPWWGPVAPGLFALVWWLTHSYTLLQLVVPLAGAGVVLLTYHMARDLLDERAALLAAAFLACFPLFREYSSTSYTETISALVLTAALLSYLRGRLILTILFGTLAALSKMDLLMLYFGVIGSCMLYTLVRRPDARQPSNRSRSIWFHVLALLGPALLASPWIWSHYLNGGQQGPTRGLSAGQFGLVAPQLLELLFYIPWYGALITLAAIGAAVVVGLRTQRIIGVPAVMLGSWFGLGLFVLLVYAATPGSGNSPRVIIPALPPLALLFGAGFGALANAWRRRIGFYLVVLFLVINLFTIGYDGFNGITLRGYEPVWQALRQQPRGYVLTEKYWDTILYTRQPATWFEADEVFQKNIMQNGANFAKYVEQNPIRYVVLPAEGDLAGPEVRAYLNGRAAPVVAGKYLVYRLY